MDEFADRVALVTGGTRGIGLATAVALAKRGCRVVCCYRSDQSAADALQDLADEEAWRVVTLQADVGRSQEATRLVAAAFERFGKLDFLVNSAGTFVTHSVEQIEDAEWDAVLRSNLHSVFYCSRAVLPLMRGAGGGAIVNVASIAGKRGSAMHAHYAAAKGGVLAFTRSLAKEAIGDNIRVNAVCPGRIATDMLLTIAETSPSEMQRWIDEAPIGRLGAASEVADVVLFLLSNASSYIVGETIDVDGGHLMD